VGICNAQWISMFCQTYVESKQATKTLMTVPREHQYSYIVLFHCTYIYMHRKVFGNFLCNEVSFCDTGKYFYFTRIYPCLGLLDANSVTDLWIDWLSNSVSKALARVTVIQVMTKFCTFNGTPKFITRNLYLESVLS
jgi:hypothetical protein